MATAGGGGGLSARGPRLLLPGPLLPPLGVLLLLPLPALSLLLLRAGCASALSCREL
jgi:hypothetical protein